MRSEYLEKLAFSQVQGAMDLGGTSKSTRSTFWNLPQYHPI